MKKICTKCGETKGLEEFSHDRASNDGFSYECKECMRERDTARRKRYRDRTPDKVPYVEFKTCGKCAKTKPAAEFYRAVVDRDGLSNWCILCSREYARSYHSRLAARRPKDVPRIKMKRCPMCGSEKPTSEFSIAIGKPDGYRTFCKECDKHRAAEYAERIADRDFEEIKPAGKKTCTLCHRRLPVENFNYCRSNADGLLSHCRECGKDYKRKHYEQNRDDYEKRADEYRRRHPDRRRAYAAVDAAIKTGELVRPDTCSKCGKGGGTVAYHRDYDEPLEVVWLCLSCSRQLHADLRKGRNKH
jgi:hypothetical protein